MKANNFTLPSTAKNNYSLKNSIGSYVVLYFYPKDNTPGCTAQACNLTENQELLKNNGFEILGVSADSAKKHQNFISK